MVWDVRCEAAVCQRNHTSYQAPVLVVQVRLPCNSYCPESEAVEDAASLLQDSGMRACKAHTGEGL